MTALPSSPLDLTRRAGVLSRVPGQVQQAQEPGQPEPVRFPEAVSASPEARINALKFDTAVEFNKRNTPAEVSDLRNAPRFSIAHLNSLSPEQIRSRVAQFDDSDRRPGWVKFLDLIDAPRNFIAQNATKWVLPEARRMAVQRGDFDQFGQPKVYGADVLRAIGLDNKIVNGVGGFLLDVFTDPLSWIGGPIGGLKTVGSRGAVQIGNQGQRLLRRGIQTVEKTGSFASIADDATRKLLESTINAGRLAGQVDDVADGAKLAQYASDTLLGTQSLVSRTAERATLGGSTRGGALAEDLYKSVGNAIERAPGEAERVQAVKDFVARYTNNGKPHGLSSQSGKTAEILHIPFTSRTLRTKPFDVPGMGLRAGGRAEIQRAIALAGSGKVAGGARIADAAIASSEAQALASRAQDLVERQRAGTAAPEELTSLRDELDGWQASRDERLKTSPNALDDLETPETIDDLLATAELEAAARADLRRAAASLRLSDVENAVPQEFTPKVLESARAARAGGLSDSIASFARIDKEAAFDALANPEKRTEAINLLIDDYLKNVDDRYAQVVKMSNADLDAAEAYVDSIQAVVDAAAETAMYRGTQIRSALGADDRLLVEATKRALGVSDDALGTLPLASLERLAQTIGQTDWANSIANQGIKIGSNLGGVSGYQQSVMQAIRRVASGADDEAARVVEQFKNGGGIFEGSGGLNGIASRFDIEERHYDLLAQWATMKAENVARVAAGLPEVPIKLIDDGRPTSAGRFIEKLNESGLKAINGLEESVETLAGEAVSEFRRLGDDMVRRGDSDSLISAYIPAQLRPASAARARALQQGTEVDQITRKTANALNQPATERVTNLVEFTDKAGESRRFMLLEADVFGSIDDVELGQLAQVDRNRARKIAEIRDDIDAFKEVYGTSEQAMRDISRPMMPFELNDYAASGALDGLVGGPLVRGDMMFETNLGSLLYNRTRSARVQEASDMFREVVEPYIAMKIPYEQHRQFTRESAVLQDGTKLDRLGDGRYRMGGVTYRHAGDLKLDPDSLFTPEGLLGADARDAIIPEQMAVAIERMSDTLRPENMGVIMRAVDKATSYFKTTTLLHPSWTIGNAVGNTVLTAMADPAILSSPKRMQKYLRMQKESWRIAWSMARGKAIDPNTTIMLAGRPTKMGDIHQLAVEGGVLNGGGMAGDIARQWTRQQGIRPSLASRTPGRVGPFVDSYHDKLDQLTHLRSTTREQANAADKLRAGAAAADTGVFQSGLRNWFAANGAVDDAFRLAYFMNLVDDGYDAASAAEQTRRALLNFGDMSSFERNYVRPLIPFYAWTRASLPNMLMRTFRDPKQISVVPKLATAFEEMAVGEERLPRWKRPSWLQQQLAIQLGDDPQSRLAIQLGTLLPQEGVKEVVGAGLGAADFLTGVGAGFTGRDFMDAINWAFGQTGPAVKIPSDLAFGRESFTGRSIGAVAGEGDVDLDEYLLNQVRPIREFGAIQKAYDRDGASGAIARSLIGGRAQTGLGEERRQQSLYFELKEHEKRFRTAIKRMENDGEDTTDKRIELLSLYADYLRKGVEPTAVPKYVRQELAEIGEYSLPE